MGTLKFTPRSETQVREWFAAHLNEFDYSIVKSGSAFPDYILEDDEGRQYRVEVESESANFIRHKHDAKGCDFVLCWCHNIRLPLPVLELLSGRWYEANETSQENYDAIKDRVNTKRQDAWEHKVAGVQALCQGELATQYTEFICQYAKYLKAHGEYLSALQPVRMALLRSTTELRQSIRKQDIQLEMLSPEDLFNLLNS